MLQLPLRSLYRPLIARHLSPLADRSASSETETTRPSLSNAEPVASSSKHTSEFKHRLREWTDNTAIAVRGRADEFTSTTKTTLSQLGFQLNKMTGYEEIETLKRRVVEQETRINDARNAAREAKTAYDMAVVQRSNSQRESTISYSASLTGTRRTSRASRRSSRRTIRSSNKRRHARAAAHAAEEAVEHEFTELMRTILARYHEEQVWSDKIRSASTYGSLAALSLNLLVFVVAIIFVEPWKRRRLAATFEKKIEEMGRDNKAVVEESMNEIGRKLEAQALLLETDISVISAPLILIMLVSSRVPRRERCSSERSSENQGLDGPIRVIGYMATPPDVVMQSNLLHALRTSTLTSFPPTQKIVY
ncbi:Mdm33 family-domain-containing protein [Mycena rosella]|uniref:Sensitive to high expression protein 9, mitochondrial n=1 Tax=Mycena rosella TaxID=1033263 RepID=A0AAD7DR28_MYCRO|nr:Mdm33 family-domain-containing protein [Mycena rosella]